MTTRFSAEMRADTFCANNRALPELDFMVQQLRQHVQDELLQAWEQQLFEKGFERKERQWWIAMLRCLSRVIADQVWEEAVRACNYTFHQTTGKRKQQTETEQSCS